MGKDSDLNDIFNDVTSYLDEMDSIREKVLNFQRSSVRLCSEAIKKVHRNEWDQIDEKLEKAKKEYEKLEQSLNRAPGDFQKDYRTHAAQELGEAIIFYNLIVNEKFPTPKECGIREVDYPYALSDVIGELKRYVLKSIRNEKVDRAFKLYDYMEEIYSHLFSLDYPGGLIPGLRRKIDIARKILSKTEGDITMSANIIKLNKNLDKHK